MRSLFTYAAILYTAAVNAAPFQGRSASVSASQLAEFTMFSQYAGAAYCFDPVHKNGTIDCATEGGSCPLVEAAKASVIQAFQVGETKTLGYVAADDMNKLIVIAIQGTQIWTNPMDILTDINLIRSKTDLCGKANKKDGCLVHDGFHSAMKDAAVVVVPAVEAALKKYPNHKVIATGHSLGGAVSALLGTLLRNRGHNVDIYTFGQPKLGEVDISNYIQNQAPSKGMNYRVTHFNDIVPQLPEHSPGQWDHYYPEFWIDKNLGTVATSDMKIIEGSLYETAGNEGAKSGLGPVVDIAKGGIAAHGQYFGAISACSSKAPFAPSAAHSSGTHKRGLEAAYEEYEE